MWIMLMFESWSVMAKNIIFFGTAEDFILKYKDL